MQGAGQCERSDTLLSLLLNGHLTTLYRSGASNALLLSLTIPDYQITCHSGLNSERIPVAERRAHGRVAVSD